VLQRFERRLEDLVGGAFARLFKGQVEPVEIAKALQREADENRAVMGGGRVLVPNRYVVELGPSDHERLAPWETQLTRTLAEMVQEFVVGVRRHHGFVRTRSRPAYRNVPGRKRCRHRRRTAATPARFAVRPAA
jgi:hypothetical protein